VSTGTDRLGTGVAFPFLPDAVTGALDWSSGAENVHEAIRLVLQTSPGERVMRPAFGAGLSDFLMDPNNPATRAALSRSVQAALAAYEVRITVTGVEVVAGEDPSEALITVSYLHVRDSSPGSVGVSVQTAGALEGSS
jgi:phage baseplate assembly protein W